MRGRSSSPGPLLRRGDDDKGGRHRHRGSSGDRGGRRRRDSHSGERSGHRHEGHGHHRRRGRSRSRSGSPARSASPAHAGPSKRRGGRSGSRSPRRRRDGDASPSSSRHHNRKRRRSHSTSSSSSSSSSGSDGKRHKSHHRKHKHKRRSSHSRERREKKRAKKEKKKKGKGAVTSQWGQYGLISDADLYNKEEEFRAWLIEEKMINREALSKDQEKKLFSSFVEDFNTATLPHEKYYNMAKYDARMNMMRNGELQPQNTDYDPNADLQAHTASHKRTAAPSETYLSKDQLTSLRKVQNERIEAGKMKVLGLDVKQTMGVRMDGNQFEAGRR